jgi:hypothetical protein
MRVVCVLLLVMFVPAAELSLSGGRVRAAPQSMALPVAGPFRRGAPAGAGAVGTETGTETWKRERNGEEATRRALALRGGGAVPARDRSGRPGKDPPLITSTDLLDLMTRGKYSRDVARFEKALESDGIPRALTAKNQQDDAGDQVPKGNLKKLGRSASGEAEDNESEDEEEYEDYDDDEAEHDGGIAASDDLAKYPPGAAAGESADENDGMQDGLYLWAPDGQVTLAAAMAWLPRAVPGIAAR